MKKAIKTISYIVYPPNYSNDGSYIKCDTKKKAFKTAIRLGNDAEVHRNLLALNSHGAGTFTMTTHVFAVVCSKYLIEELRNGRNMMNSFNAKIRNINGKYACVFRKKRVKCFH